MIIIPKTSTHIARKTLFSRREALIGVSATISALILAPDFSFAEVPAKVPAAELYAPQALPDIFIGKTDAPITIIEYASLTCTHCAAFYDETFPTLKSQFIDTGKVRFALREFPLDPLAAGAAMLARASGDKRDVVVDFLFRQQKNWAFVDKPLEALEGLMKQTGMSSETFKKTLEEKTLYDNVMQVRQTANEKFGVSSTPAFFINGDRKTGGIPVSELEKQLAPYLPK